MCSQTLSEQKPVLERSSNGKAIVRMKKAIYHFPSRSPTIYTRSTDDLSGILAVFTFDRNLFVTKVYERAYRSSIKDRIRALKFINKTAATERSKYFRVKKEWTTRIIVLCANDAAGREQPFHQVQGSCYKKRGYLLVKDQQDYSDESLLQHRVVNAFRNLSDTVEFSPINVSADNILIISELWSRLGRLVLRAMQNGGRGPFLLSRVPGSNLLMIQLKGAGPLSHRTDLLRICNSEYSQLKPMCLDFPLIFEKIKN